MLPVAYGLGSAPGADLDVGAGRWDGHDAMGVPAGVAGDLDTGPAEPHGILVRLLAGGADRVGQGEGQMVR